MKDFAIGGLIGLLIAGAFVGTIVGIIVVANNAHINSYKPVVAAEKAALEQFLVDHGDVVALTGLQDEFKKITHGKRTTTQERVWRLCQFKDGYTVEIEQRHNGPTARVPLEGEHWRLKIWVGTTSTGLYLYEKVDLEQGG